jgi:hypothetical protein
MGKRVLSSCLMVHSIFVLPSLARMTETYHHAQPWFTPPALCAVIILGDRVSLFAIETVHD